MSNPATLKPPWKPGQSGNPTGLNAGRPRKRPLTEAYDDRLRSLVPPEVRMAMKLPKDATWADAIALGIARKAIAGDVNAAKEQREATEGKAPQRIEIATPKDREIKLRIEWGSAPIDVEASVPARVERIIQDVVEQAVDEEEKDS